jgi:hypothetical protein
LFGAGVRLDFTIIFKQLVTSNRDPLFIANRISITIDELSEWHFVTHPASPFCNKEHIVICGGESEISGGKFFILK